MGVGKDFLTGYKKHKHKIDKLGYVKIKKFYSSKTTIMKVNRQDIGWEGISAVYFSNNGQMN